MSIPNQVDELIDATAVAKLLRLRNRRRVYELVRCGLLPAVQLGPRTLRFSPSALRAFIDAGGLGGTGSSVAAPLRGGSGRPRRGRALVGRGDAPRSAGSYEEKFARMRGARRSGA